MMDENLIWLLIYIYKKVVSICFYLKKNKLQGINKKEEIYKI